MNSTGANEIHQSAFMNCSSLLGVPYSLTNAQRSYNLYRQTIYHLDTTF